MDYERIRYWIENSPAIATLRKQYAPLALSFLYQEFKRAHRYTVLQAELIQQLDNYLYIRLEQTEENSRFNAETLINQWSNDGLLYIRMAGDIGDYIVQLTPDAESIIGWFEDLEMPTLLATESRLRTIYTVLEDLVTKTEQSVEERLALLEQQRAVIDAEITQIKTTGQVEVYSPVKRRGQLQQIEDIARQLLRDFAAIEERFRDIAQVIREKQLQSDERKGTILKSVLQAHDELKSTEEGQSFYAFRDFLMTDQQDTLQQWLTVVSTPDFSETTQGSPFLRDLISHLLEATHRIDASNQRLAQNLRYLLDERTRSENQRVRDLIMEIKQVASQLSEDLDPRQEFIEIEEDPFINFIMERPLFEVSEEILPSAQPLKTTDLLDEGILEQMFQVFYVDEGELERRIEELLMSYQEITLTDVVRHYPIYQGVPELVGYIRLAACQTQHQIDLHQYDVLSILNMENTQQETIFRLPHIVYRRAKS